VYEDQSQAEIKTASFRKVKTVVSDSPSRRAFLSTLAVDIITAGGQADLTSNHAGRLRFEASLPAGEVALANTSQLRARQRTNRPALLRRANRRKLATEISPGPDFDPTAIRPRLVVCRSRADHDVFSYAKLSQSVPSAARAGRRLRLLVMDEGEPREAMIGVMELASPIYTLACRDEAFGWRGQSSKKIRTDGLRRVMDLSTCLALPPYSTLRAGKLLAMLAASDVVSNIFRERYGDRLAAITATCATGLHYPHLNRLNIRQGGLYNRVGATAGYSTCMFSGETFTAARKLVQGDAPAAAFGPKHMKGLRLLRSGLRACGLDDEIVLRTGVPKGVYVCDVAGDGIEALAKGVAPTGRAVSTARAFAWWREKILVPRIRVQGSFNVRPSDLAAVPPLVNA
jgi:hypothetical protein